MEQTLFQQAFFSIGAANTIQFNNTVDMKLTALCEAVGVKFKKKR